MFPKLVIFDFDGVLIDSEMLGHQLSAVEMTRLGFPMSVSESIELLTGTTPDQFEERMIQKYGKTLPQNEIRPLIERIDKAVIEQVELIPGIIPVLDYLDEQKVLKCIATNSRLPYVQAILKNTDLGRYFQGEHIFYPEMVQGRGKPQPDIFQYAMKQFQLKPEECVVIEDSWIGVAGAKAAQMKVVGFLAGAHAQDKGYREEMLKAEPVQITDSSDQLLDLFKGWILDGFPRRMG